MILMPDPMTPLIRPLLDTRHRFGKDIADHQDQSQAEDHTYKPT